MKVAALDLGSNSFLCLIAEVEKGAVAKIYSDQVEIVRLGQDLQKNNFFHVDALQRAQECLTKFKQEIIKHKPEKILAVATAAARTAQNKEALRQICDDLQIPLEIISGEKEAQITFSGAVSSYSDDNISRVVIDIGGGSTEMIVGNGHKLKFGESVPIGGVKLTEKFITGHPVKTEEKKQLMAFAEQQLKPVVEKIKEFKPQEMIAVAGTPTELAKAELGFFDPQKIDGYFISTKKLKEYCDLFAAATIEERIQKYKISKGRADIIFTGSYIQYKIAEMMGVSGVYVSTRGVRFGAALDLAERQVT